MILTEDITINRRIQWLILTEAIMDLCIPEFDKKDLQSVVFFLKNEQGVSRISISNNCTE